MVDLNRDEYIELFLSSDLNTIKQMSQMNSGLNNLYSDEKLWKQKFLKEFEPRALKPKSWKMAYLLQMDNIIKFKVSFQPFDFSNPGDDLTIHTLDCEIPFHKIKVYTDKDGTNFNGIGLRFSGNLLIKFVTDVEIPDHLYDKQLKIQIMKELSKYFRYAEHYDFEAPIYRHVKYPNSYLPINGGDGYYVVEIDSKLVLEIIGICNIF